MYPSSKDAKLTVFSGERKPEERASPEARLLKSIDTHLRWLTYALLFLTACVIAVGIAGVVQLSRYTILSSGTLNSLTTDVRAVTQNAATMTTLAVPVVSNLQFMTSAATAAVYAATNASDVEVQAAAARREGGTATQRHLLAMDPAMVEAGVVPATTLSEADLILQDYKLREAMYKSTRHLMSTLNTKAEEFNPAAVSDFLTFLVESSNFTGIATRFDRVLGDVEQTAHFGVLAGAMLGLASQATNTSLPSASDLFKEYGAQKAASSQAGHTCA